jgi:hypothetical protein
VVAWTPAFQPYHFYVRLCTARNAMQSQRDAGHVVFSYQHCFARRRPRMTPHFTAALLAKAARKLCIWVLVPIYGLASSDSGAIIVSLLMHRP